MRIHQMARFTLGQVLATPGALQLLERADIEALSLLARHQCGDWGQVDPDDWNANEYALKRGWRLCSAYAAGTGWVLVMTEADRSATTILLPDEY